MLVEANDAVFGYDGRAIVHVHKWRLDAGECVGMFGPNGSGKTTLVRGLMGLLPPMSGQVQRAPHLRLGYLPQHRSLDLHWPMTALDAASMAISARRRFGRAAPERESIRHALRLLEVEELQHRPFAGLSGGQQQRILLAGALAAEPQLLVLDEPTEGLDVRSRRILLNALRRSAEQGIGTVLISHSVDDLAAACENIGWMHPKEDENAATQVENVSGEEVRARVQALRAMA